MKYTVNCTYFIKDIRDIIIQCTYLASGEAKGGHVIQICHTWTETFGAKDHDCVHSKRKLYVTKGKDYKNGKRKELTQKFNKIMPRIKDLLFGGLIIVLHCVLYASREFLVGSSAPGAGPALLVTSRPLALFTCGALDPVNDLEKNSAIQYKRSGHPG